MRNAEGLARDPFEEIAVDCFARGIGDRVHQAVHAVPDSAEFGEQPGDFVVARDVAGKHQPAAEIGGHVGDTVLEAVVLVGKREFGALAMTGSGDAIGDRTVAEQAGNENALSRQKTHDGSAT